MVENVPGSTNLIKPSEIPNRKHRNDANNQTSDDDDDDDDDDDNDDRSERVTLVVIPCTENILMFIVRIIIRTASSRTHQHQLQCPGQLE